MSTTALFAVFLGTVLAESSRASLEPKAAVHANNPQTRFAPQRALQRGVLPRVDQVASGSVELYDAVEEQCAEEAKRKKRMRTRVDTTASAAFQASLIVIALGIGVQTISPHPSMPGAFSTALERWQAYRRDQLPVTVTTACAFFTYAAVAAHSKFD